MIVLDATNKSLQVSLAHNSDSMTSVVSYWSVDSSNVWTPGNFEASGSGIGTTVILPAPGAGEKRVVENMWIHLPAGVTAPAMNIIFDVGGTQRNIAAFTSGLGMGSRTTLVLGRDGMFNRQSSTFAGVAMTLSQNVS